MLLGEGCGTTAARAVLAIEWAKVAPIACDSREIKRHFQQAKDKASAQLKSFKGFDQTPEFETKSFSQLLGRLALEAQGKLACVVLVETRVDDPWDNALAIVADEDADFFSVLDPKEGVYHTGKRLRPCLEECMPTNALYYRVHFIKKPTTTTTTEEAVASVTPNKDKEEDTEKATPSTPTPTPAPMVAVATPTPAPAPTPAPVAAAAPKKKVVRKRTLATPTIVLKEEAAAEAQPSPEKKPNVGE